MIPYTTFLNLNIHNSIGDLMGTEPIARFRKIDITKNGDYVVDWAFVNVGLSAGTFKISIYDGDLDGLLVSSVETPTVQGLKRLSGGFSELDYPSNGYYTLTAMNIDTMKVNCVKSVYVGG